MYFIDKHNIGNIIKNARKKAGLKQYELAEKAGFSEKHLSRIENGKYLPKLEHFLILASILNLRLEDFGIISSQDGIPEQKAEFINRIMSADEERVKMYYETCDYVDRMLNKPRIDK